MTQAWLGQIPPEGGDPFTGGDLAGAWNAFDLAHKSGQFSTTAPAGITKGGVWSRDNGDGSVTLMLYNGATSVPISPPARSTRPTSLVGGQIWIKLNGDGSYTPQLFNGTTDYPIALAFGDVPSAEIIFSPNVAYQNVKPRPVFIHGRSFNAVSFSQDRFEYSTNGTTWHRTGNFALPGSGGMVNFYAYPVNAGHYWRVSSTAPATFSGAYAEK